MNKLILFSREVMIGVRTQVAIELDLGCPAVTERIESRNPPCRQRVTNF